MADLQQLERALINADKAGDTDAARQLAAEIRRMRHAAPQEGKTFLSGTAMRDNPNYLKDRINAWSLKDTDDIVRSVASGASFGFADELAAAGNAATSAQKYGDALTQERERDRGIDPVTRMTGEVLGGTMTGTGLARSGATLMNAARPTVGNMALRGGTEGALYGAAYGAGSGENPQERVEKAIYGGTLGAATGGVMGAVGGKMAQPKVPKATDLKSAASQAYQAADDAGVIISRDSFSKVVDDIQGELAEQGLDATLHPRALAAFNRLQGATDENVTLKGAEILRRVIRNAAASNDPSERRLARIMIDRFDDYIGNLGSGDVVSGNVKEATKALSQARDLWTRSRKAEIVDDLVARAKNRASQFSGSGYENALRTEFRSLAQNPKRMRGFTKAEQEAIRKVAQGGPVGNLLRMIGKFAPTGVVSSALSGGVGYSVGGPAGAVVLPALGFGARQGATALTGRNATIASELMRAGPRAPIPSQLTPQQQALLRALTTGGGQLGAKVPPMIGTGQ